MQQFLQNSSCKLGTTGLQWFSKWIPGAAALLGSQKDVIFRPNPRSLESETLGLGPSKLLPHHFCRFWCTLTSRAAGLYS